ncbi:hypothetical protein [Thiothrix winogradskyi]|uniref:Uncharacterized protein n=1 Tax=Thiothrix winogradskyi TaxID=96472 RepID=A0ABY3T0L6_9GAMM|nr:hypothetical protein [Thiothrix winogradskyi]UJS25337.1 hypothetical protein L2Y54_04665 [Thiothrix winogradskyi]
MGYILPPNATKVAAKFAGMVIAGMCFVAPPANAATGTAKTNLSPPLAKETSGIRSSRKGRNLLLGYVRSDIQPEARYDTPTKASEIRKIPTPQAIHVENAGGAESFYGRVESIMTSFGFNKSQLSAVLNVQRKSIYDWKSNLSVEVRSATVDRVQTLEDFAAYMDNGHSRFLSKLAFGSLGHKDLAQEITKDALDLTQLKALYDNYWLEFDGMYKRAKLREATKDFSNESSKEELFISV